MNIANLIMNHLLERTSTQESGSGIFTMFTRANIRKFLMICAGIAGSLVLFVGGCFTVLTDLVLTSREYQALMLSPASFVGFALVGISVLCMFGLFSRKVWRTVPAQVRAETPAVSPVQEAMADLIRDFVEERKVGREMALAQFAAAHANPQAAAQPAPGSSLHRTDTNQDPNASLFN